METDYLRTLKKETESARRICVIGVGNIQKGDDGTGPVVIKILKEKIKKSKKRNILLIDSGEVPENITGEIRRFLPDLTIIIDACISGEKPGTIYLVNPDKIKADDISTHRLSLSMFVKFLTESIPTKVIVIGIEPKNLNFREDISLEVSQAIEKLIQLLDEFLKT